MRRVATSSKCTRRPHTATVRRFGCKPEASSESSARRCINSPASLNLLAGCGAEGSPTLSPSGLVKCSTGTTRGCTGPVRAAWALIPSSVDPCIGTFSRRSCLVIEDPNAESPDGRTRSALVERVGQKFCMLGARPRDSMRNRCDVAAVFGRGVHKRRCTEVERTHTQRQRACRATARSERMVCSSTRAARTRASEPVASMQRPARRPRSRCGFARTCASSPRPPCRCGRPVCLYQLCLILFVPVRGTCSGIQGSGYTETV